MLQQVSKVLAKLMTAGTTLCSCRHIFFLRTPRIAGGLLLLTGQFFKRRLNQGPRVALYFTLANKNQYRS